MRKLIIFILLGALLISNNTSALGVNSSGRLTWNNGRLEWYDGTTFTSVATFNKAIDDLWITIGDPAVFNHVILATEENIPANSLVSFTARYMVQNNTSLSFNYYGVQFEDGRTLLNDSCVVNNLTTGTGAIGMNMLECSYVYYSPYTTQYVDFSNGHHILEWALGSGQQGANGAFNIVISPASYIQLTNDGLSSADRAWLEEHMPSGSSTADIESAIEAAREDEKSEYEEQQDDVEGGADDAGEEAEAATSTLIETGRSIIETIRDTPATNCVIRINTRNFDTGNLNLCNVPQEIRTVISTVITIPVTLAALHIAYSVVMLYLNTVRKEQE